MLGHRFHCKKNTDLSKYMTNNRVLLHANANSHILGLKSCIIL